MSTVPAVPGSIGEILERMFPRNSAAGPPYLCFPTSDGGEPDGYGGLPFLPPDMFAATAYLLELSGAYHHIIPEITGREPRQRRLVHITLKDIEAARRAARAWRDFRPDRDFDPDDPSVFKSWLAGAGSDMTMLHDKWHEVFVTFAAEPVFRPIQSQSPPPTWWKSAALLAIASDEAASGVGFEVAPPAVQPGKVSDWASDQPGPSLLIGHRLASTFRQVGNGLVRQDDGVLYYGVTSISTASEDVVSVLPKARTAAVGCTLRSLSHHLALLPPRGVARASWTPYLYGHLPPDEQQMNLLLIPFPFSVPAHAFRPSARYAGPGVRWGFFDVEQTWLKDLTVGMLAGFIGALVEEARKECDTIHGVVLPELALDQALYSELSRQLPGILPGIELFVSGQSGDAGPKGRRGNFVSVTLYQSSDDASGARRGLVSRREKHHRWKIDSTQIADYGLEGILSPSMSWWEDIDLLSRRVDFGVVRCGSILSAMICEDLARVDPCQELLRAVGPSIVFALLMDAPQFRHRWPARYATVLADDPGTAILTLTSRALMTRQHRIGTHPSKGADDRVVALWRDDRGTTREIACPIGAHGIRLTLSGRRVTDATLDGRDDPMSVSWRYAGHAPIQIKDVAERFGKVLGEDDLALQSAGGR